MEKLIDYISELITINSDSKIFKLRVIQPFEHKNKKNYSKYRFDFQNHDLLDITFQLKQYDILRINPYLNLNIYKLIY